MGHSLASTKGSCLPETLLRSHVQGQAGDFSKMEECLTGWVLKLRVIAN